MNHCVGGIVRCTSLGSSRKPPDRFSKHCCTSSYVTLCFRFSLSKTRSDISTFTAASLLRGKALYIHEQYKTSKYFSQFCIKTLTVYCDAATMRTIHRRNGSSVIGIRGL